MNGIVQTGIMIADLANDFKQTEIMNKQLRQDRELAMLEMKNAQRASENNERLQRELNTSIVNAMKGIERRLGDISNKLDRIGSLIRTGF